MSIFLNVCCDFALSPASLNANVSSNSGHLCQPINEPEDCDVESTLKDWLSMAIIFTGIFLVGIGSTGIYSFGLPFLDDSAGKENSPYSLTFAMVCRTLGPGLGFLLGTASLSMFVYPDRRPQGESCLGLLPNSKAGLGSYLFIVFLGLGQDDPRWIGAWWMGFIILSVLVTVISPLLTLFPPLIPGKDGKTSCEHGDHHSSEKSNTSAKFWVKEFTAVSKRLMTNKLFVCNLLSTTFILMAVIGFATFLPKYFEFVFRRRASTSGIFGGLSQSLASMFGIAISGFVVGRFRPRARPMAAWCAFVTFLAVVAFIGVANISCGTPQPFFGYDSSGLRLPNLTCDLNCGCSRSEYSPVCSVDGGTVFFSPCQAGCKNSTLVYNEITKKQVRYYFDCSCVEANSLATASFHAKPWWTATAIEIGSPIAPHSNSLMDLPGVSPMGDQPISAAMTGYCPMDCEKPFYSLMGLMVVMGVLVSTSRLPNTLLSLRSVEQIEKRDKSSSMTLTVSFVSLFAILPSPLIFGALYDSSCSLWGERCGSTLNCLAYDTETLQFRVCLFSIIIYCLAFICDVGVWYFSNDVQVYDDLEAVQNKAKESSGNHSTTNVGNEVILKEA